MPAETLRGLAVRGLLGVAQYGYDCEVDRVVSGADAVHHFAGFEGGQRELEAGFFL